MQSFNDFLHTFAKMPLLLGVLSPDRMDMPSAEERRAYADILKLVINVTGEQLIRNSKYESSLIRFMPTIY